jgi:hypothetical protein
VQKRTDAGHAVAGRAVGSWGGLRARLDVPHAAERILRGEALAAVARDAGVSRATLRARIADWREVAAGGQAPRPD